MNFAEKIANKVCSTLLGKIIFKASNYQLQTKLFILLFVVWGIQQGINSLEILQPGTEFCRNNYLSKISAITLQKICFFENPSPFVDN
jgi:hypothetical protein